MDNNFTEAVMEAIGVSKQYPGTLALNNVSFKVYTGKVNILIGENGAGKSTLMRLLAGIEQPTSGEILLEGKPIKLLNPKDASSKGIGMIHQELNLFPDMNIMQNMFMGQELTKYGGIILNAKKSKDIAATILKRLEHDMDTKIRVGDLRMGQQQIIEIAKTMVAEGLKVLIMDEPTSSLSKNEVDILFRLIDDLKSHGVSIVYISHRMEEIMQVGDYITILRDGNKVAEDYKSNVDIGWIVQSMVGRERKMGDVNKPEVNLGKEILRVEEMTLPSTAGGFSVDHVSFNLHSGEIFGIYGLLGAGRTELLESLMGIRKEATGKVFLDGAEAPPKNIPQQIKRGLYLIPEDRKGNGIVNTLNIEKNLTLSSMDELSKMGCLIKSAEAAAADKTIDELSIKVADKKLPILSLSGGNQQKVVIGKALLTKPKILLMDEPTRGIDVNAKEEVFKLIFEFAKKGYGVIVVASELGEILRVSDRIMVLSSGKAVAVLNREEATEERLVRESEAALNKEGA